MNAPAPLALQSCFLFKAHAKAKRIDAQEGLKAITAAAASRSRFGFAWFHCQLDSPVLAQMHTGKFLDDMVFGALTASDTRPRCVFHDEGFIINLRGKAVDELPEEVPLVSLRFWVTPTLVVSAWRRPSVASAEFLASMERGARVSGTGDFIGDMVLLLNDSIEPMVDELSERVDDLELDVVDGTPLMHRRELSDIRRDAIELRRYLYPQRDAISTLLLERRPFLREQDRAHLHEANDRLMRFIEELETTRERCTVLHDEIIDNRAERMNRQMLLLSIVSALFLPLALVAGLLGMNVGGIPGVENPVAFWIICGLMGGMIVGGLALLRWMKLL